MKTTTKNRLVIVNDRGIGRLGILHHYARFNGVDGIRANVTYVDGGQYTNANVLGSNVRPARADDLAVRVESVARILHFVAKVFSVDRAGYGVVTVEMRQAVRDQIDKLGGTDAVKQLRFAA